MNKKSQHLFTATLLFISLMVPAIAFAAADYIQDPEKTIKVCRACHDNHQMFPLLINSNPTTHHLLHNTTIQSQIAPNSQTDKDGLYDCMTCHSAVMTEYGPDITAERDCLQCHDSTAIWPKRHHALLDSITAPPDTPKCLLCHIMAFNRDGNTLDDF